MAESYSGCLCMATSLLAQWDPEHVVSLARVVTWPFLLGYALISWRRQVGAILERLAKVESLEVAGIKVTLPELISLKDTDKVREHINPEFSLNSTNTVQLKIASDQALPFTVDVKEKIIPIRIEP